MSVEQRRRAPVRRRLPDDPQELPIGGSIDQACWLSDDVLAATISFSQPKPDEVETLLRVDESWIHCETSFAGLETRSTDNERWLMVIRTGPIEAGAEVGPIVVRSPHGDSVIEPLEPDA